MEGKVDISLSSSSSDSDVDDKYEMVPPEGGWGYVVCFGLSVIFIAGTSHQPLFGFIYNDFLDELGVGTGVVTVVWGVFQVTLALTGFSANVALKWLSLRQVGLIGAFVYTLASFLAIFVTTTTQMVLTNGFLQGVGMGFLIPVSYTSFNSYFTKKKVLYLSLCKASIGLVTMIYPLLMKVTMVEFGFRGTLAVLCAISAHSIVGALVMHPVEWHLVKQVKQCSSSSEETMIPVTPEDKKEFNFKITNTKIVKVKDNSKESALFIEDYEKQTENLKEKKLFIPIVLIPDRDDKIFIENLYKATSVTSLGNLAGEPMPIVKNKKGKWQTIVDYFDLSLLNDLVYDNIIIGLSLTFFADLTFFTLEPLFLERCNLSKSEITNIISVGAATDMIARLVLGAFGQFYKINSRYMYMGGAYIAAIGRILFVQFSTYTPLLILTGVLGTSRSLLHIAQPIVIAEHVPIERYPPAYGLYMLLIGAVSLGVGPMIGFIRDYTGSYVIAFSLLTVCNLLCAVPWTIEYLVRYYKKKSISKQKNIDIE